MNNYTKINEILHFSDVHPVDHRFILSYISELEKENEKLNHYKLLYQKVKERNDLGIERLEALIVFWKKYNPIDNTMQVEQFKGVIELLKGNNDE